MSIATDHETNEDDKYHDSLADIEDLIDTLNDKKVIKDPIQETTKNITTNKETNEDDVYYDSLTIIIKNLTDTSKDEKTLKNSNPEITDSNATDSGIYEDDEYHDSVEIIGAMMETPTDKKSLKVQFLK